MLFHRFRGITLKQVILMIGFGVFSSYYINQPIRDELEKRYRKKEEDQAIATIMAANKEK